LKKSEAILRFGFDRGGDAERSEATAPQAIFAGPGKNATGLGGLLRRGLGAKAGL